MSGHARSAPNYLICLDDTVIAMDLAQMIRAFQPGAVVETCGDHQGRTGCAARPAVTAVFIDRAALRKDGAAGLLRVLSRSGQIVLLGSTILAEDPDLPRMWVVEMPFYESTIRDLLSRLAVRDVPEDG